MSEKRYLLTESDISKIGQLECDICDTNAMGRFDCSDALDAERHRMLESHEYRERTCRLEWFDGEGDDDWGWRCSECGSVLGHDDDDPGSPLRIKRCPECGAKVVEP